MEVTAGQHVVLMSRVSVTVSYLFRGQTTETEEYVDESSFVVNSAVLKYCKYEQSRREAMWLNLADAGRANMTR